jgi:hypothetical protein
MDAIPGEAHPHSSPTHSHTVLTFLHRYNGTQSHATANSKDPTHPFVLVSLSEGQWVRIKSVLSTTKKKKKRRKQMVCPAPVLELSPLQRDAPRTFDCLRSHVHRVVPFPPQFGKSGAKRKKALPPHTQPSPTAQGTHCFQVPILFQAETAPARSEFCKPNVCYSLVGMAAGWRVCRDALGGSHIVEQTRIWMAYYVRWVFVGELPPTHPSQAAKRRVKRTTLILCACLTMHRSTWPLMRRSLHTSHRYACESECRGTAV